MKLVLISTVALSLPPCAAAQVITLDTLSLYNLPGVWVQVDSLSEAAQADGLSMDTLRHTIEQALRDAQIPVFTQAQWQNTLGNPLLALTVNLLRPSDFLYLYNLKLELRQLSTLPRDSVPVFGTTWSAGDVLGSVPTANLPSLRGQVTAMTHRFIRAYVAARDYRRPWIRPGEASGETGTSAGGRTAVASSSNRVRGLTETRP